MFLCVAQETVLRIVRLQRVAMVFGHTNKHVSQVPASTDAFEPKQVPIARHRRLWRNEKSLKKVPPPGMQVKDPNEPVVLVPLL